MTTLVDRAFGALVADSSKKGGLSDAEHQAEPANFFRHVGALTASKIADGLVDPKLVLSWLLTHLGAGAGVTGMLVPIRESGALLPQLFTAGYVSQMRHRKWAWVAGAAGQAIAAAGMVLAALTLSGAAAGWTILMLLALLAVSRSVCSVSFKDILGKTIGSSRRGTVAGAAATVASSVVIIFALLLIWDGFDRFILVVSALGIAVIGWIVAAVSMASLNEMDSNIGDRPAIPYPWTVLKNNPQLAWFVTARSLMVGTALAPPYLVLLSANGTQEVAEIGGLVLASAVASFLSSYVWGRFSDRSSRQVLIVAGIAAVIALGLALGLEWLGIADTVWAMPVVLFGLMIAYHGVRQGRSTHLVDMAGEKDRADFTAVSNTVVGLFLLGAGAVCSAIATVSVPLVIWVFIVMSIAGSIAAYRLNEVQSD